MNAIGNYHLKMNILVTFFCCWAVEPSYNKYYKYYVSGHYPSSCLYLKVVLFVLAKNRTMDNVHKHNICIMFHRHKPLNHIYNKYVSLVFMENGSASCTVSS
jgi:hypothetical protein